MKRTVDFCNFCHRYVDGPRQGKIIYVDNSNETDGPKLRFRIFDKATVNDVCICNRCSMQLPLLLQRGEE